jgi:hypothetical protein
VTPALRFDQDAEHPMVAISVSIAYLKALAWTRQPQSSTSPLDHPSEQLKLLKPIKAANEKILRSFVAIVDHNERKGRKNRG